MKRKFKYFSSRGTEEFKEGKELYDELSVDAIESLFQYRLAPGYTFPGETHDYYEFFYCLQGKMKVITGLGTYKLKAGEFIIVPPLLFHAMIPDGGYSYSVSINFGGVGINDELITKRINTLNSDERHCINAIVKSYTDNFEERRGARFLITQRKQDEYAFRQIIKNHLEILLIMITRDFQEIADRQNEKLSDTNATIADRVKTYIDENYAEKLSLEKIAADLGYSSGHICRAFKKKYVNSVVNYMLQCRIQQAMLLIDKGEMSMQEISDTLGFDSVQYFSKIFKRFANIPPGEYKRTSSQYGHITYDYFLSVIGEN